MNFELLAIKRLNSLIKIHIDSYNFSVTQGLFFLINYFLNNIGTNNTGKYMLSGNIIGIHISKPYYLEGKKKCKILPRQCRETKSSYTGDLIIILNLNYLNQKRKVVSKVGKIPIMVKSLKCNLFQLDHKQLVEIDEEKYECGGYFILKGIEKIARLLIVPKRNIFQVISRLSNTERGHSCTSLSCSIRSVDRIHNSKTLHLHYLKSGCIYIRIIINRREFFFPVVLMLKCFCDISDKEIFEIITEFDPRDKYLRQRAVIMIKNAYDICDASNRNNILEFIGKIFRPVIDINAKEFIDVSERLISEHLLIHLGDDKQSKINILILMIHRLLMVQKGVFKEDNPDSIDSQEFLLPGQLILIFMKEKLQNSIERCFSMLVSRKKMIFFKKKNKEILDSVYFQKIIELSFRSFSLGINRLILLGSLYSNFKEELSQLSGLTISAERLNFGRFLSYFRSIHRGKFLSEIKNTIGRKLFPESWGFLCPVDTPDGALCGIINHLSSSAVISFNNPIEKEFIRRILLRNTDDIQRKNSSSFKNFIFLDGKILGFFYEYSIRWILDKLRSEKVSNIGLIPIGCEISYSFYSHQKTGFYGCFLFSEEGRALRPVLWKKSHINENKKLFFIRNKMKIHKFEKRFEMIGTFEQTHLNIQTLYQNHHSLTKQFTWTHEEIDPSNILSVTASMTPFSDLNQSPRNMYQCQMSKQSVGIPFYTFWRRDDIKNNFILNPQLPICRNKSVQDGLNLDAFPNGVNAIVSILSYTGFDMEDAMIISKPSIDRGFCASNFSSFSSFDMDIKSFKTDYPKNEPKNHVKNDKLPTVGNHLTKGEPLFLENKIETNGKKKEISICYNRYEKCVIEKVKMISSKNKKSKFLRISVRFRAKRKPMVGDKFASRHGQKGVLSLGYCFPDLPFSEIGIVPDIIFNPHGFPSRMTIGVILESMGGKCGALDGTFHDSSSFRMASDYLGTYLFNHKLRETGFQYYGNEVMYSGYSGEPLNVDIFTGIIHYQRLRHMVIDKFQVSEISPRNAITRQPIKGKKIGGAIRFGEMERDALLGHGSIFLLHDRIQLASDLHAVKINPKKGNIIGLKKENKSHQNSNDVCLNKTLFFPYVTKYLISELSVMSIKTILNINEY